MDNAAKRKKVAVLGGILLFIILLVVVFTPAIGLVRHHFEPLPHFGPREVEYRVVDGKEVADTIYHEVPPFSFVDQDGQTFTEADTEGKILVVDFMFTTCTGWCPIMTSQMQRLVWKLDDPAFKDVRFLSHTVDPEHDTPQVLSKYARKNKISTDRWKLLTGEKKALYEHGVHGFFLAAEKDALAPEGFLHSKMFVLVDRKGHIRGYYDGLSATEVDQIADDIKMLLKEEKINAKNVGK